MLKKEEIIDYLHHYNTEHKNDGFLFVSLFGSYARDEYDTFSDIDLTYNIDHEKFFKDNAFAKLSKIDEIKQTLQNKFHKKIDLIPENTKNKLIQKSLQKEQVFI